MIDLSSDTAFVQTLYDLLPNRQKIVQGMQHNNRIIASAEIRYMPTVGGFQFAIARIDYMNRRNSSRYTYDPEEAYLHALDLQKEHPNAQFYLVEDGEHTYESVY